MKDYTDEELAQLATWAEAGEQDAGNQLRVPQKPMSVESQVKLATDKRKAYGAIRQGIDWLLRTRILERQSKISSIGGAPELMDRLQEKKQ